MTSIETALPREPYRGLEPYRFCDQSIFFERDRESERLMRLITMYRGSLLYGESGVGKSSLINAGLIPRVVSSGVAVERVRVQPRLDKEFVVERIPTGAGENVFLPSPLLEGHGGGRTEFSANSFLDRVRHASRSELLLVFDQFEELLTLTSDQPADATARESQKQILAVIVKLLQDKGITKLQALFVFREDYLAKFERLFYFCPELPDQFLRLTAPGSGALDRVIRGPFETERIPSGQWKREISAEVAAELKRQLSPLEEGMGINLSQLQIAALQLWRAEDPAAALAASGVDGLVRAFQDGQLKALGGDRAMGQRLLSSMVTRHGTRKVVIESELLEQVGPKAAEVLNKLVRDSRLVRRDYQRGAPTYEIVSEFLVPWIRQLKRQHDEAEYQKKVFKWGSLAIAVLVIAGSLIWWWRISNVRAESLVRDAEARTASAEKQRDDALKTIQMQGSEREKKLTGQIVVAQADAKKQAEAASTAKVEARNLERVVADLNAKVSVLEKQIQGMENENQKPSEVQKAIGAGPGASPPKETAQANQPPKASQSGFMKRNSACAPKVLRQVEPEFSDEARKARYQGTVTLSARVDSKGRAVDIKVEKSLGLGLDEQAIKALQQWEFTPIDPSSDCANQKMLVAVNFKFL